MGLLRRRHRLAAAHLHGVIAGKRSGHTVIHRYRRLGDGDFDADLRWAWNTIGDPVQPEDARNGSAWCLRLFGLQQFDKFLPLVAKSIGMADTRAKKMRADRDRQFAILAALQAEFAAQEESGAAGAGSNA